MAVQLVNSFAVANATIQHTTHVSPVLTCVHATILAGDLVIMPATPRLHSVAVLPRELRMAIWVLLVHVHQVELEVFVLVLPALFKLWSPNRIEPRSVSCSFMKSPFHTNDGMMR